MGYDLKGDGGRFRWNVTSWPLLLELAQQYGWEPQGTTLHDDEGVIEDEWAGGYCSNDGQQVSAADAAALADALERALPDIPNHDAMEHKTTPIPGMPGERGIPMDVKFTAFELFSGENKAHLREFISYCHKAGFWIG